MPRCYPTERSPSGPDQGARPYLAGRPALHAVRKKGLLSPRSKSPDFGERRRPKPPPHARDGASRTLRGGRPFAVFDEDRQRILRPEDALDGEGDAEFP